MQALRRYAGLALALVAGCDPSAAPGGSGDDVACVDQDGDGVTTCDHDCDDADPTSAPGLAEVCGDGVDNNCDGVTDEGCTGTSAGIYVSGATGSDAAAGTRAAPLATITAGITAAHALGGAQTVYVAQGTYPEKVRLVEGVDVNGGYQCTPQACTWARDLVAYASTIAAPDFEGVLAGAGITPATLLGGFTITGKDGTPAAAPGGAALTISGGSPTVRGNRITGGTISVNGTPGTGADRSAGILLRSTGAMPAVIENNDVAGGRSSGTSAAIVLEAVGQVGSLARINANVLRGGQARRSIGVLATGSVPGTQVTANDIIAGSSAGGASFGIEVTTALTIDRNRINVDRNTVGTCTQTTLWCAGIASESATAVITNNVVYGPRGLRSTAVLLTELERPGGMVVVNSNYLSGGGSAQASGTGRPESAAIAVSVGSCTNCGFHGFVGRVRNNILDGGAAMSRYGVREDPPVGRTAHLDLLETNDLWFQPLTGRTDVLYRRVGAQGSGADLTWINDVNALTTPQANLNFARDPQIDATWHLSATSPCIDGGVSDEAPATDFEDDARPNGGGPDVGPDER